MIRIMDIKKATISDNKNFVELFLISAPFFPLIFGQNTKKTLNNLFVTKSNLFSYQHVCFAKKEEETLGMILCYNWETKNRENLRTGHLMFKNLGIIFFKSIIPLVKLNKVIGKISKEDFYISNIAIYDLFRGLGTGKQLIFKAEETARKSGSKNVILDVEKENIKAINFYNNIGFRKITESTIKTRNCILSFYRMKKQLI
ncbi:acetyltransferase [Petrotoga sp. 9PWA.NaAc.5.4]|nr:acetyltransferase [Petrotoga sp. 9PWA.NaAc.5.4]